MLEPTTRRAELFVRGDLPNPACHRRDQLTTRLDHLVDSGVLASYSVSTWDKRQPADDDDQFDRFAAWAETAGVSLLPFFDTRTCYEPGTVHRHEYRVRPAICLVLYDEDGEIDTVYPHSDGGCQSVVDGITTLGRAGRAMTPSGGQGMAD